MTLRTITTAFDGAIDTVSTRPLVIKAVRSLGEVGFLIPNPVSEFDLPAFVPDPLAGQEDELPLKYSLWQNYPNPFNPTTTIAFDIAQPAYITLKVYNILGQEVATLCDRVEFDTGNQQIIFDGSSLASGVYFYRLVAEGLADGSQVASQTQKMVLLK